MRLGASPMVSSLCSARSVGPKTARGRQPPSTSSTAGHLTTNGPPPAPNHPVATSSSTPSASCSSPTSPPTPATSPPVSRHWTLRPPACHHGQPTPVSLLPSQPPKSICRVALVLLAPSSSVLTASIAWMARPLPAWRGHVPWPGVLPYFALEFWPSAKPAH
jgi:hypothetical protein